MNEILDLVTRACTGDRASFGVLYDMHVQEVYRFLLSKTSSKEEAQDLTSDTFMKALNNITSFSPQRSSSFRAWLFTLAYRSFIDSTRKRRPLPLESVQEPASPQSSVQDAEHALLSQTFHRALAQLNTLQRETLVLRIWHDYSFKEIAEVLGKSEGSVKMLMKRGLLTLKTLIPPHPHHFTNTERF